MTREQKANELIAEITRTVLNEVISHAQIILHDLNEGEITLTSFEKYANKQPKCSQFLLRVVGENIYNGLEMFIDNEEECQCDDCKAERAEEKSVKKKRQKKAVTE